VAKDTGTTPDWAKYCEPGSWHEATTMFPVLPADEMENLAEDIRQHGLLNPLVLHADKLIDGRNRLLACKVAGVTPRFTEWKPRRNESPIAWVVSQNLKRRHLTPSQKAFVTVEVEKLLAKEAKERQLATSKYALRDQKGQVRPVAEKIPQPEKGRARDQAAKLVGVNPHYVTDAKRISQQDPELAEQVRAGKLTLTQARRILKERQREARREQNRKTIAAGRPLGEVLGSAKFATIVIDPPWDWGDESDADQLGRARPTYATMPYKELLNLPMADIADEDCHLYLWITNRSLPKGFGLLEAWGFRYITCVTWCKPSFGMGNYFRGSTEHVLFGIKGSMPLKRKDIGTWFSAPRGKVHSEKPDAFFSLVESCSPGPYVDVFGRRERAGWTILGAEVANIQL